MMDVDDDQNGIVEACMGYVGAIRVMVIDEMADVNEQVGSFAQLSCDFLTNNHSLMGLI